MLGRGLLSQVVDQWPSDPEGLSGWVMASQSLVFWSYLKCFPLILLIAGSLNWFNQAECHPLQIIWPLLRLGCSSQWTGTWSGLSVSLQMSQLHSKLILRDSQIALSSRIQSTFLPLFVENARQLDILPAKNWIPASFVPQWAHSCHLLYLATVHPFCLRFGSYHATDASWPWGSHTH